MWFEFEYKDTYEAKVANALDKLEVQIQTMKLPLKHGYRLSMKRHFCSENILNLT
ncbi:MULTISPECIES: hypothetical protein [Lysinibacillus]|uniref:hypothetical protein n=1 Tax=Lysinibacillus TaxID=400634 RepID=UPI000ABEBC3C|nr:MULTISPECIES: hypothetical protein [Lysinibacillus]